METIEVQTMDLRAGDVIVGCSTDPLMFGYSSWQRAVVLTDPVTTDGRNAVFSYRQGEVNWPTTRGVDFWWKIESRTAKKTESSTEKHIDPFPGVCDWCGCKAYVSALAVAHENETAAQMKNCPARRA